MVSQTSGWDLCGRYWRQSIELGRWWQREWEEKHHEEPSSVKYLATPTCKHFLLFTSYRDSHSLLIITDLVASLSLSLSLSLCVCDIWSRIPLSVGIYIPQAVPLLLFSDHNKEHTKTGIYQYWRLAVSGGIIVGYQAPVCSLEGARIPCRIAYMCIHHTHAHNERERGGCIGENKMQKNQRYRGKT